MTDKNLGAASILISIDKRGLNIWHGTNQQALLATKSFDDTSLNDWDNLWKFFETNLNMTMTP